MKFRFVFFIALILFAASCKEKRIKTDITANNSTQKETIGIKQDTITIAGIGSIKITEQTIRYRIATEAAYENTGLNNTTGLIMLINDALEMELAKKYNQQALPNEIVQFKQYADATSKAPEILNKVKNVFGQDIKSYDLWYIAPKIVNRKIRDYFSSNKTFNQAALNQIKPAMKILRSGKKMKEVAKSLHLTFARDSIPLKPLDMTPALQNYPDATLPFENPMMKYVKKMTIGEIYPEIIEENYSFLIIKLLNHNLDRYLIERISVPKPDFDSWLKKEAENIPIGINNSDIKRELQSKYSNLWWVSYIQ